GSHRRAYDRRREWLSGLAFWRPQSDVCVRLRGRQAVMSRSLSERKREKLTGEIAGLQSLDVEQLKARWRTLYQTEAPTRFSRELLIRAVAYRLQERALGGLNPATRCLFQRIAADAHARRPLQLKPL